MAEQSGSQTTYYNIPYLDVEILRYAQNDKMIGSLRMTAEFILSFRKFFDKLRMSAGNTERYILRQAQNERNEGPEMTDEM
jgi:hypothetical protein